MIGQRLFSSFFSALYHSWIFSYIFKCHIILKTLSLVFDAPLSFLRIIFLLASSFHPLTILLCFFLCEILLQILYFLVLHSPGVFCFPLQYLSLSMHSCMKTLFLSSQTPAISLASLIQIWKNRSFSVVWLLLVFDIKWWSGFI